MSDPYDVDNSYNSYNSHNSQNSPNSVTLKRAGRPTSDPYTAENSATLITLQLSKLCNSPNSTNAFQNNNLLPNSQYYFQYISILNFLPHNPLLSYHNNFFANRT